MWNESIILVNIATLDCAAVFTCFLQLYSPQSFCVCNVLTYIIMIAVPDVSYDYDLTKL